MALCFDRRAWFVLLLCQVRCPTAVSNAYDGRRTMGITAVNSAADGRRTMSITQQRHDTSTVKPLTLCRYATTKTAVPITSPVIYYTGLLSHAGISSLVEYGVSWL